MDKKLIIGVITVVLVGLFLGWMFIESSKSLPGQKLDDQGREHVPPGTEVQYNTNPPTSGKHYADWTRAGIYEEPKDDGYLVHSLEHGYVVMSYNCNQPVTSNWSLVTRTYAHGVEEEEATQSAQATSSDECHNLVDSLISVYEKKGKRKLIIVPRPNLDSKIALSAWAYLDKFNDFDAERIEKFIDTHRDQGPEKTME